MDKQFEKGRTITQGDGTIMVIFDGKLHNWEGPALIPEGNKELEVERVYLGIRVEVLKLDSNI